MGGILLLLALSVVMALASFLAGALPLSITLSPSQLRLLSSIGVGILVGTSMIVIIPEGIEAIATTSSGHNHSARSLHRAPALFGGAHWPAAEAPKYRSLVTEDRIRMDANAQRRSDDESPEDMPDAVERDGEHSADGHKHEDEENQIPTFYIGFALVTGFVLMFLIDRLPRHATDSFQAPPTPRHISLDNLASPGGSDGDAEADGLLGSLAPSPKQSRSLATTTGLVIHAAADGIAMGASATTSNMKLGLIIFVAIMIHKAPAAFGLTSVLLKQGLSKRAARGHLIVFSLAAPVGALVTYMIVSLIGGTNMDGESGQWWTGMLLLFSAGTFLFVAMHAMQEDAASHGHEHSHSGSGMNGYSSGNNSASQRKQKGPQMRDTVATVVGMLVPLLTQFGHHHH